MEGTSYSRKLDGTGRIVIPKPLLERMGMIKGNEYNFFTHEEPNGRKFICIECPGIDEQTLAEARRIVEKYGLKDLTNKG